MQTAVNTGELYLEKASGAMSRRDYLSAIQFALRAAESSGRLPEIRCDAYLLLALSSLEMDLGEDALAFSVGAHLAACWSRDEGRQEKAAAMVSLVSSRFPHLGAEPAVPNFH